MDNQTHLLTDGYRLDAQRAFRFLIPPPNSCPPFVLNLIWYAIQNGKTSGSSDGYVWYETTDLMGKASKFW